MNIDHQLIGIGGDNCKGRITSPEPGAFQFSQMPAIPNGAPSFIPIAYGCFAFSPLIAFHSKKPSTGTMQRRLRYASRKVGKSRTVSHLALMGFRPPFGSLHQYGMRPQRSGSSDTSPVLCLRRMTSNSWLGAARSEERRVGKESEVR